MHFTTKLLVYASVALIAIGAGLMIGGAVLISSEYGVSTEYIASNLGAFCGFGAPPVQLYSLGGYTVEIYTYPQLPRTGEETSLNFIVKDDAGRYVEGLRYTVRIIETASIGDAKVDIFPIHESGEELCKYGSCVSRYTFKDDGIYRVIIELNHDSERYVVSFYTTVYKNLYLAMFPAGLYLMMAGGIAAVIALTNRLFLQGGS